MVRGGFTAAPGSPFDVGNQPFGIAVGDFNGDRKLDLAVANTRQQRKCALGDGGGGFRNAPAPLSPSAIAPLISYLGISMETVTGLRRHQLA
jgi:hypothetical protein